MPHPRFSSEEIARRGEHIYDTEVRRKVEHEHIGKFLAVDIETGEYEIDPNEVAAMDRAATRNPTGARYLIRIGFRAAHRLGGRLSARRI